MTQRFGTLRDLGSSCWFWEEGQDERKGRSGLTALERSAHSPSFPGKLLAQEIPPFLELWVIGVLAPDKGSLRTKFWGHVSVERAGVEMLDPAALLAWRFPRGNPAPRTGQARGDARKGKTAPDRSVAETVSKGTYLGDLCRLLQAE